MADVRDYPEGTLGLTFRDDVGMSNFDMSIDEGVEQALAEGFYVQHSAWDHCGYVWCGGDGYAEEVWVEHEPVEIMWAPSLRELMDVVNEKYGSG